MISGFSMISALALYSIMLAAICKLYKREGILEAGGWSILLFACFAATARLLFPIEIPTTHAVWALPILGLVQRFFRAVPIFPYAVLAVWAAGTLKYMAKDIRLLLRTYKRCRGYTVFESKRGQEIVKGYGVKCRVLLTPDVEGPYVVGIVRHTIYLPYPELTERQMVLTLAHEAQHIKSHDALVKLFFGLLSEAVWWNFLSKDFQKAVDALLEMRCDKRVTKNMTEEEKTEYLHVLADVADRVVSDREALALGMNESFAVGRKDTVLEQRFKVMNAARKRKSPHIIIAGKCLVGAVFLASYLVIVQPTGVPSEETFRNDTDTFYIENYDGPDMGAEVTTTFIIKGPDGRYQLFVDYSFVRYLSEDEVVSDNYKDLYIFEEERQR